MKIFKSVFRLDYPVNYIIIDHLGEQFDSLISILKKDEYKIIQPTYDVSTHSIRINAEQERFFYNLEITPVSISGDIEYKNGKIIDSSNSEKFFKAVDSVLAKIEILKKWQFDRIGLREFYLAEEINSLAFHSILNKILDSNKKLVLNVNPNKSVVSDVALFLEIDTENGLKNNVKYGPYRDSEKRRYFRVIDPMISEGLIIDLDSYLVKYNIPNFKFSEFSKRVQSRAYDIVKKINDNLKGYDND